EANEARAMPEPISLHLVEADLRDELGTDGRFLELTGSPAVRLREAAIGRPFQQRLHPLEDLFVAARGDRGRTDVVHLPVLPVKAEEKGGDACGLLLPADADDDAVGRLVGLDLEDAFARAGEVRQPEPLA